MKILDNMKIYVLGTTGMLGKYISKYLKESFDVINVDRNIIDAAHIDEEELYGKFLMFGLKPEDIVINCMGTIKPRVDELGDLNAILVNAVFPRILANVALRFGSRLIHPTTDCVYSGLKGAYIETDPYDVNDVYGMSKAMGEPKNCTIIRTSIIGEEVGKKKRSLVEWVKSSEGQEIKGFNNHFWNGVTCLQFAKICERIINEKLFWMGTRHIFSNILTKKELVETINDIYGLNITVMGANTPIKCDRTLLTIVKKPEFLNPTLDIQIKEMKDFSELLYA